MYEPSRNCSFRIAGLKHRDGMLVLGELKAGDTLELVPERDNPYDTEAIAVKFNGTMLGYVPADSVGPLSTLFFYGHGTAFERRVLQVAPERSPWHQVRTAVFVRDAR